MGPAIPLGARILQVVDCYDALISDRPYRPGMSQAEAIAILRGRRGTMYDPQVVDTFVEKVDTLIERPPAVSRAVAPSLHRQGPSSADETLMSFSDDVSAIATSTMATLFRHFGASAAVLYVYDAECDGLRAAVWCGSGASRRNEFRMALGDRLSGWVGATRRMQANADGRLDASSPADPLFEGMRCALSVPIERGSALVGVLTIYANGAAEFTPADVNAAELLARLLAHPQVIPETLAAAAH
jgi:hypothetical protein